MAEVLDDVRAAADQPAEVLSAATDALENLASAVEDADSDIDADAHEHDWEEGEYEAMERRMNSAWEFAAALHTEAHDPKTPFVFCNQATCVDLKDRLHPGWRESRPTTYRVAV